jgi:hypothetical protein
MLQRLTEIGQRWQHVPELMTDNRTMLYNVFMHAEVALSRSRDSTPWVVAPPRTTGNTNNVSQPIYDTADTTSSTESADSTGALDADISGEHMESDVDYVQ